MGDGLDLSTQFLLDLVEVEAIFVGYKVDSETKMPKSARTTDTMEVCFGVLRKVEVDDDIDCLDIDTTGEEVGTDKVAADTLAEVVEDAVAVGLEHLRVRVET